MDPTSIALIAGLLSSLFTVFVTKLLDLFQNKKQHRYNIERLYFEKKINAAELIVSQMTILSGALMHIIILFERLKEQDNSKIIDEFESHVDRNLELTIDKQLKQNENTLFVITNTLMLYFDVNDKDLFSKESTKELHNLVGQVGTKLEAMDNAHENLLNRLNSNEYNKAVETYNLSVSAYKSHIQLIIDKYETLYAQLVSTVELIRNDISQYELQ